MKKTDHHAGAGRINPDRLKRIFEGPIVAVYRRESRLFGFVLNLLLALLFVCVLRDASPVEVVRETTECASRVVRFVARFARLLWDAGL